MFQKPNVYSKSYYPETEACKVLQKRHIQIPSGSVKILMICCETSFGLDCSL